MLGKSYVVHDIQPSSVQTMATLADGVSVVPVSVPSLIVELVSADGVSGTIKLAYSDTDNEEALAFFSVGQSVTLNPTV